MRAPSLEELNEIRKSGFRPEAVGCFLNDRKILFVYDKKYNLWQLPQGGIENKENIETAFWREMEEELGREFAALTSKNLIFLGEDEIEFPVSGRAGKKLEAEGGRPVLMRGKKYFFVAAETRQSEIRIEESEFADYRWVNYKEGMDLAETIYQKGKKRITMKALNLLRARNLI